jgi:hypothetical protein
VKASLVNWLPLRQAQGRLWSVLKISARPLLKASSRASTQKPPQGCWTRLRRTKPARTGPDYVGIHDGHQVEEAPGHGDVGDVGGPHLVDPVDLQPREQVGIDLVPWGWLAGVGTPVVSIPTRPLDGLQAH